MKKQVAVVGAGYWGEKLVRNFDAIGCLKTVCEKSPERLKELQQKYSQIKVEDNYKNVLGDPEIQGVVLATPAETHFPLAQMALEHGKNVFVEKPLCLNPEEGGKLCSLARQKNRIIMVGHLLHYHPAVMAMKKIIFSGQLGKIHHIYANRLNLGIFRSEENVMWSFAPHDISVILSLTNSMPGRVMAKGTGLLKTGLPDTVNVLMEFAGDLYATVLVSWLHPFKEQRLVISGERGMVVFNDVNKEEKLLYYPEPVKWQGMTPVPDKRTPEVIPLAGLEPLKEECLAFVQALQSGKQPITNGEEGLKVLQVLSAAQQSLDNRAMWVTPPGQGNFDHYFAHPTATIDAGCVIGAGTRIWHYSHIMSGAIIGAGCNIGQNVVVAPGVQLGQNVKVQNNVSVYTGVICEEDVFLGPSVVFTNIKTPRSHVSRRDQYVSTRIRRGASIGANATIVCGVDIGEYALVGAGAVVTKDVPAYGVVYGNPADLKGWACRCGSKLGFSSGFARCDNCAQTYIKVDDLSVKPL